MLLHHFINHPPLLPLAAAAADRLPLRAAADANAAAYAPLIQVLKFPLIYLPPLITS